MSARAREGRPGVPEAAVEAFSGAGMDCTESDAAVFFRNAYAVLVRGKSVRRHLYFNLPGAQRVVDSALRRGDRAELVLVRLVPVEPVRDDVSILDADPSQMVCFR